MLGSFAPQRLKTSMPSFTPPAPYTLEANPDSFLDGSDLVFINPVGTGYSATIAPARTATPASPRRSTHFPVATTQR
jgi:carboxypeptidase C (cathepsin A)